MLTRDTDYLLTNPILKITAPNIETWEVTVNNFLGFLNRKANSKPSIFSDLEVPSIVREYCMDLYWSRQGPLILPRRSGTSTLIALKALVASIYTPYKVVVVVPNIQHVKNLQTIIYIFILDISSM